MPIEHVAEENLPEAGFFKYLELAGIEHLDFAAMILIARTFVGTQLEQTILVGRRSRWERELWPSLESDHQRAFDTDHGRLIRGSSQERRSGF